MPKYSSSRQSAYNLIKSAKEIKGLMRKTWDNASKCPMFVKKTKDPGIGKKKIVRTNRLISNHAYKVAASGAAAYVQSVLNSDAQSYRLTIPNDEAKRYPSLPSLSKGAINMIEGFLCAYAQEATSNASEIRKALESSQRLNAKLVALGFDAADAAIFGATTLVPRAVYVSPMKKRVVKDADKSRDGKVVEADTGAANADAGALSDSDVDK
jgi:hypothetical protein